MKLTLFFTLFCLTSAKLPNIKHSLEYAGSLYTNSILGSKYKTPNLTPSGDLWLISLDQDLSTLHLEEATADEVATFNDLVKPVDENLAKQQHASRVVKKDDPFKSGVPPMTPAEEKEIIAEISIAINKFMLSLQYEPSAHLIDPSKGEKEPSLALYFKGLQTALIATSDNKQWVYCFGPHLLPAWFFDDECVDTTIPVPADVRQEFFVSFLRLIRMLNAQSLLQK